MLIYVEITMVFWQWSPGMKVDSVTRPPRLFSSKQQKSSFSREECEILCTFNNTKRGVNKGGDRMLEWAANPAYNPMNVRLLKMKSLQKKVVEEHVPDGVFREELTEKLDGQTLVFFGRSLYESCKELLRNVRFAGSQYVQADVCYDGLGKRKLGALNRGEMYESCQRLAGSRVSPVPVFLSSDTTVVCKKMGGHPIIGGSFWVYHVTL